MLDDALRYWLIFTAGPSFLVAGMVLLGLVGLGLDNWIRAGLLVNDGESG